MKNTWKNFNPKKSNLGVFIKTQWQEMVGSCVDVFIASKSLIPRPIESRVTRLNHRPDKPAIILDNPEFSEEHATFRNPGQMLF